MLEIAALTESAAMSGAATGVVMHTPGRQITSVELDATPPLAKHFSDPHDVGTIFGSSVSSDAILQRLPRALVVEGSRGQARSLVADTLASAGYEVVQVASGFVGLQIVQSLPDVVLVDLNLADMSGLDFCRAIRSAESTARVPTVILSIDGEAHADVAAFEAGADEYIDRVNHLDVLLLRVNRIVRGRRFEGVAEQHFAGLSRNFQRLVQDRAEFELQHRLTALAMLTSGLAHEMNNPLAALMASLEFVVEDRFADPAETLEAVHDAMTAAKRIAEVVRKMRGLAGPDDRTRVQVNMRQRCEAIAVEYPATAIRVLGDDVVVPVVDGEVREALRAMVDNAVRAASAGVQPQVEIQISCDDDWVTVTVDDNGPGIAPADLPYVSTPFFSRHRGTHGQGLGLSLASATARRHDGRLMVENNGSLGGVRVTLHLRRELSPVADADETACPLATMESTSAVSL